MPRLMKRTPVAAPEQNSNNGVLAAQADLEAAVAEVARVRGQLLTGGVLSAGAIDALAQAWLRQKQRRGTFESYLQRMGLIDAAQLQRLSVPGEEVQPVSPSTDAASTSLPQVAISDESATAAPSLPPSNAEPDADELEISAQVDEEAPRQPSLPQDFIAGLDESDQVSQPTTVMTLRSGSRFGRYLLEEELGRGATATIFRSFHDTMHIPVAVKIFSPLGASDDPAEAERFLTEARLLAKLDHPSIVRVLDVALRGRLPYIVFEYVGELSLEDLLDNIGQLPAERIAQIGIEVAAALQFAWTQGLLHRDIKPSNVPLRKDGHVKLADFGIASMRTADGKTADESALRGLISGTPSYMAPEAATSPAQVDARSDMYSLGATLYHAAVGHPPIARATPLETLRAQIDEDAPPLLQELPFFSVELSEVIMRLLSRDPAARYETWDEVQVALRRAIPTRRAGSHSLSGLPAYRDHRSQTPSPTNLSALASQPKVEPQRSEAEASPASAPAAVTPAPAVVLAPAPVESTPHRQPSVLLLAILGAGLLLLLLWGLFR